MSEHYSPHDRLEILRQYDIGYARAVKEQGKAFKKVAFIAAFAKERSLSSQSIYRWLDERSKFGEKGIAENKANRRSCPAAIDTLQMGDTLARLIEPGKSIALICREFREACRMAGKVPPKNDTTIRRYIMKHFTHHDDAAVTTEPEQHKPILITGATTQRPGSLLPTGIFELDRVLSPGFFIPSSVVFAGDPGIGKSTLLMQACMELAKKLGPEKCLYISTEQNIDQISKRAAEIQDFPGFNAFHTESLTEILAVIEEWKPKFCVIDSIKRVRTDAYQGSFDSPQYMAYCAKQLTGATRKQQMVTVLVNHLTKSGDMAGLKSFEHDVDAVLFLRGNPLSGHRLLSATKNRFGDTMDVGFFRMTSKGLKGIDKADSLFVKRRRRPVTGVAWSIIQKGYRSFPVEIQCLISPCILKAPSLDVTGLDREQVKKVLRIMKERLKIDLYDFDIGMTTVHHVEVESPFAQTAVLASLMGFVRGWDLSNIIFLGEVDYTGHIWGFHEMNRLIIEGLRHNQVMLVIAPPPCDDCESLDDSKLRYIESIDELEEILRITSPSLSL